MKNQQNTIKKIDELSYDIESYENYKDVYDELQKLKIKIICMKRPL